MAAEGGDELEAFFVRVPKLSSSSATAPRIHSVIHPRCKPLGNITEWILGSGPEDDDGGGWRVTKHAVTTHALFPTIDPEPTPASCSGLSRASAGPSVFPLVRLFRGGLLQILATRARMTTEGARMTNQALPFSRREKEESRRAAPADQASTISTDKSGPSACRKELASKMAAGGVAPVARIAPDRMRSTASQRIGAEMA